MNIFLSDLHVHYQAAFNYHELLAYFKHTNNNIYKLFWFSQKPELFLVENNSFYEILEGQQDQKLPENLKQLDQNEIEFFQLEKQFLKQFSKNSQLIQKMNKQSQIYYYLSNSIKLCYWIFYYIMDEMKSQKIKFTTFRKTFNQHTIKILSHVDFIGMTNIKFIIQFNRNQFTYEQICSVLDNYSFVNFATKKIIIGIDFVSTEKTFFSDSLTSIQLDNIIKKLCKLDIHFMLHNGEGLNENHFQNVEKYMQLMSLYNKKYEQIYDKQCKKIIHVGHGLPIIQDEKWFNKVLEKTGITQKIAIEFCPDTYNYYSQNNEGLTVNQFQTLIQKIETCSHLVTVCTDDSYKFQRNLLSCFNFFDDNQKQKIMQNNNQMKFILNIQYDMDQHIHESLQHPVQKYYVGINMNNTNFEQIEKNIRKIENEQKNKNNEKQQNQENNKNDKNCENDDKTTKNAKKFICSTNGWIYVLNCIINCGNKIREITLFDQYEANLLIANLFYKLIIISEDRKSLLQNVFNKQITQKELEDMTTNKKIDEYLEKKFDKFIYTNAVEQLEIIDVLNKYKSLKTYKLLQKHIIYDNQRQLYPSFFHEKNKNYNKNFHNGTFLFFGFFEPFKTDTQYQKFRNFVKNITIKYKCQSPNKIIEKIDVDTFVYLPNYQFNTNDGLMKENFTQKLHENIVDNNVTVYVIQQQGFAKITKNNFATSGQYKDMFFDEVSQTKYQKIIENMLNNEQLFLGVFDNIKSSVSINANNAQDKHLLLQNALQNQKIMQQFYKIQNHYQQSFCFKISIKNIVIGGIFFEFAKNSVFEKYNKQWFCKIVLHSAFNIEKIILVVIDMLKNNKQLFQDQLNQKIFTVYFHFIEKISNQFKVYQQNFDFVEQQKNNLLLKFDFQGY